MEIGGGAAYHTKAVPVRDKENKRTRKASPSANSPQVCSELAYMFVCACTTFTRKFRKPRYRCPLWVEDSSKPVII
jgi:hypothetical protein